MQGKRDAVARALTSTGAAGLILRARARLRLPVLTVLTYHRVADLRGDESFDPEVVDAAPAQFDQQLADVAEHFTVIGIDELIAYYAGAPLPPNPALITFDDGYKDCRHVVLPLLQKHGLRAVFFIATDYVAERRAYWWDRIHYLVKRSALPRLEIRYPEAMTLELGDDQAAALRRLLRVVKDTPALDLERFLGELADAAGVSWSREVERQMADELVMTWDEVRELRDAGMDVQSHTRTHRVLATVPVERLDDELGGAREILEGELGQPVPALAYPVGHRIRSRPEIVDAVRRAGYELGFANSGGVSRLSRGMDRYDVSRIGMDREMSQERFRGMLAVPVLV